jgi:hypothetical protein
VPCRLLYFVYYLYLAFFVLGEDGRFVGTHDVLAVEEPQPISATLPYFLHYSLELLYSRAPIYSRCRKAFITQWDVSPRGFFAGQRASTASSAQNRVSESSQAIRGGNLKPIRENPRKIAQTAVAIASAWVCSGTLHPVDPITGWPVYPS